MINLEPNKFELDMLEVNMVPPIMPTSPIRFRRYSMYYDYTNNKIFMTIAPYFDALALGVTSIDKIYSEWVWFSGDRYNLNLYAYVGNYPYDIAKARYETFEKLMPIAMKCIVNGDETFLQFNTRLANAPVFVRYISSQPEFNKNVALGRVRNFM